MKKVLFTVAAVLLISAAAISGYSYHQQSQLDPVILSNIEAISSGESGVTNTGPAQFKDCPGWGTGDYKVCTSQNQYPCTETLCTG